MLFYLQISDKIIMKELKQLCRENIWNLAPYRGRAWQKTRSSWAMVQMRPSIWFTECSVDQARTM